MNNIPKLRFKNFKTSWKKCKFGELVKVSTGYPFKSKNFQKNGRDLVITNSNIQNYNDYVDDTKGHKINYAGTKYLLNNKDILLTMDGDVGRSAKVKSKNMVLAQRVCRITVTNLKTLNFIYQLINTETFRATLQQLAIGGIIKHISLKNIRNSLVYVPSLKEQYKIGKFFNYLDKLIELAHKNNTSKLRMLRKAYRQKMFI